LHASGVQLVTDSAADLPEELLNEYGITCVPLTVTQGEDTFEDGSIPIETFLDRMSQSRDLPTTSQPSPGAFYEVFERLAPKGPILCMTISEKLSGTAQSARMAAEMLPDAQIEVFDTKAATSAEGAQVLRAAQLLREGKDLEEVMDYLREYREHIRIFQGFLDLTNLVKGGRLSRLQGRIADFMNIRVLCHNVDGAIEVLEKVRGTEQLFARIVQLMQEQAVNIEDRLIIISHADNHEWAEWLAERAAALSPRDVMVLPMGAVIATHAGRGSVVISV